MHFQSHQSLVHTIIPAVRGALSQKGKEGQGKEKAIALVLSKLKTLGVYIMLCASQTHSYALFHRHIFRVELQSDGVS